MRALAAYLTVILCCGFYKDKQLPAHLSLKSSSINAFLQDFPRKKSLSHHSPHRNTAKEDRSEAVFSDAISCGRDAQAEAVSPVPPPTRRAAFRQLRDSFRARASTRKCVPLPRNSSACPCPPPNIGEGVLRGRGGADPGGPMLCANGCDPARDERCLRTKPGGPMAVGRTDRSGQINLRGFDFFYVG